MLNKMFLEGNRKEFEVMIMKRMALIFLLMSLSWNAYSLPPECRQPGAPAGCFEKLIEKESTDYIVVQLVETDVIPEDDAQFFISGTRLVDGINNTWLEIDVTYGGCGSFKVFWDGSILKSVPQGVAIKVTHDTERQGNCKAQRDVTVAVDLLTIKDDFGYALVFGPSSEPIVAVKN